jgi:hypothetical protein
LLNRCNLVITYMYKAPNQPSKLQLRSAACRVRTSLFVHDTYLAMSNLRLQPAAAAAARMKQQCQHTPALYAVLSAASSRHHFTPSTGSMINNACRRCPGHHSRQL